jgi:hypothetical protein
MPSTRLEEHKKKEFYKKVGLMSGVLLLVVLFIAILGFQILIRGTIFIGNIGGTQPTPTPDEDFYGTLSVDTIPTATNSAQFVVSGSVNNFQTVEFYVNDKQVKSINNVSDSYSETIGDLQKGKNTVYIRAITKDKKHEKKSDLNTVVYKNDPPKLDISEPSDGAKTSQPSIKVAGTTDKEVFVKINDSPVVVDATGGFQESLHLQEGDNKITVTAQDEAGNITKKELTVNYHKED